MDDKIFVKELEKHAADLEKSLPFDEAKLAEMQEEVDAFANLVRKKVRILADVKKLIEKYSTTEAVTSEPWQETAVNHLMKVDEAQLAEIFEAVTKARTTTKDVDYDKVMQFVLGLLKKNRVVRVRRGVYRWIGSQPKALPAPKTKKAAKKKGAKGKATAKKRRKKASWIQVAQQIMRKNPDTIWANATLTVEVEKKFKGIITAKRMSNFLKRTCDAGLIKRVGRGEYQWAGK